ncbi:hypothetical protein niasHS_009959 [Heterodera schachtii]|uniref:Uncharacterized protein n=1 Tax=Heterodera schachtii TaxID=97005 RepID=A0ABD2JDF7_HETSC
MCTFSNFLDDVFVNYCDSVGKSGPVLPYLKQGHDSENQMRAVFNFTFVKWAAEFAHFRVIKDYGGTAEEAYPNYKVLLSEQNKEDEFVGLLYYAQSLCDQIAKEFKNEIFSTEKQLSKKVVNQIMQLSFSFAARILLSFRSKNSVKFHHIGDWQLKTLLSAYKIVSAENDNDENGIFPFRIIQIDENRRHWWAPMLSPSQRWLKYDDQRHYIGRKIK